MATVGFLGCGKIGKAMVRHLQVRGEHSIAFVQDPLFGEDLDPGCPVLPQLDEHLCRADLVVEGATADVLKQSYKHYLHHGDLLVFSLTAFSDESFTKEVSELCRANSTHVGLIEHSQKSSPIRQSIPTRTISALKAKVSTSAWNSVHIQPVA